MSLVIVPAFCLEAICRLQHGGNPAELSRLTELKESEFKEATRRTEYCRQLGSYTERDLESAWESLQCL